MKAIARLRTPLIASLAVASPFGSAVAQNEISIVGYSCREILREAGAERDIAVAFLHGYILGKAGATQLDIDGLRKQTKIFIERCLDNPQASALDSMLKSVAAAPSAARSP
jgi:hypothetical protein